MVNEAKQALRCEATGFATIQHSLFGLDLLWTTFIYEPTPSQPVNQDV